MRLARVTHKKKRETRRRQPLIIDSDASEPLHRTTSKHFSTRTVVKNDSQKIPRERFLIEKEGGGALILNGKIRLHPKEE